MDTENTEPKRADIWDLAVALYSTSIKTAEELNTWKRHVPSFVTHTLEGDTFSIGVGDEFSAKFFEERYSPALRVALIRAGAPENVKVRFVVNNEAVKNADEKIRIVHEYEKKKIAKEERQAQEKLQPKKAIFSSTVPLNPDYTFQNFVTGPSNSFAHAIATAVAKDPGGNNNNPFFIWGGTGLGKTHLMQAIGHQALINDPNKSVCYLTSETFLNEYTNALSNNDMHSFHNRYRHIDLLLLDDVQFIGGKVQVQEEFFNTYNDLMNFGKQVVMTCDVPPNKLNGLQERLMTRFQQGIVIEIESPSYETRIAILKSKARNYSQNIPECVFNYIGENIRSSVRAMEGALNLVARYIDSSHNSKIDIDTVRSLLKELTEDETTISRLTVDEVIKATCDFYKVPYGDMIKENRSQPLSTARQVAMFLARKLTGTKLPLIAEKFNRTHATIMHGMTAIQKRTAVEANLKASIESIVSQLGRKTTEVFE